MRKIIYECKIGSFLYGTATDTSDQDFAGVFIGSSKDILGLSISPTVLDQSTKKDKSKKNTKEDIDKKYYSLQKFISMAMQGQPAALEMLFAEGTSVVSSSWEWRVLKRNLIKYGLSDKVLDPSLGFVGSILRRLPITGDSLLALNSAIVELKKKEDIFSVIPNINLSAAVEMREEYNKVTLGGDYSYSLRRREEGLSMKIVGIEYLLRESLYNVLIDLEGRYAKNQVKLSSGEIDWKDLAHGYRVLFQLRDLIEKGRMNFPLGNEEVSFLQEVKRGNLGNLDHFGKLEQLKSEIDKLDKPRLREDADSKRLERLCIDLLLNHLKPSLVSRVGLLLRGVL